MIEYHIGDKVRAFTAGRGDELPCEVTQAHQVHGTEAAVITRPGLTREDLEGYDALLTNIPGLAIGVRTADCIPILLYDEPHHAVAAVHSGWKGTVKKIVQVAIDRMTREYGTNPADLSAIIGPGICSECFQVGDEVVSLFADAAFPLDAIHTRHGEKLPGDLRTGHHIDLFAANRLLLTQSGVRPENIQISPLCTYETASLFSARREGTECGRNINAIVLQ